MTLDIQKALAEWREINKDPYKWATFEATPYNVSVSWGVVHSNGMRECALQTITFFLERNGEVYEYQHTHF